MKRGAVTISPIAAPRMSSARLIHLWSFLFNQFIPFVRSTKVNSVLPGQATTIEYHQDEDLNERQTGRTVADLRHQGKLPHLLTI